MRHKDRQWSNIREKAHLKIDKIRYRHLMRKITHLVHVIHYAVHYFTLEGLKDDSPVTRNELCLAASTENHSFSDIQYGDYSYDISKLSRTCALDIRVKFGFEETEHPRTKIGRMQENSMR
jgi:hypothetical protein